MILLFIALAALEDTSKPYRPVDFTIETGQSRDQITSCVASKLKIAPVVDGNKVVLPVYLGSNPFTRGQNSFSLVVEEKGSFRSITALYRHPLSARSAIATVRDIAKTCYKAEFNAALSKSPTIRVKPI